MTTMCLIHHSLLTHPPTPSLPLILPSLLQHLLPLPFPLLLLRRRRLDGVRPRHRLALDEAVPVQRVGGAQALEDLGPALLEHADHAALASVARKAYSALALRLFVAVAVAVTVTAELFQQLVQQAGVVGIGADHLDGGRSRRSQELVVLGAEVGEDAGAELVSRAEDAALLVGKRLGVEREQRVGPRERRRLDCSLFIVV